MSEEHRVAAPNRTFLRRHPVLSFFALTYAVSWSGAFLVALPHLLREEPIPKLSGLLMFPLMLVGPSSVGLILTRTIDGKAGLHNLFARMRRVSFPAHWYAALLIPPGVVLAVLLGLKALVSQDFTPNHFLPGVGFGLLAGFLEEIGWMGYAFPKMRQRHGPFVAAALLGVLWGAWHLPVVDYLGAATPHGSYWFPFFLVFTAAMTAMRVLIAWMYSHTQSVLLAQLMHASSTAALATFSPAGVTAAQEALWYGVYAAALWLIIVVLCRKDWRSAPPSAG